MNSHINGITEIKEKISNLDTAHSMHKSSEHPFIWDEDVEYNHQELKQIFSNYTGVGEKEIKKLGEKLTDLTSDFDENTLTFNFGNYAEVKKEFSIIIASL